jgi:hypothetical protein
LFNGKCSTENVQRIPEVSLQNISAHTTSDQPRKSHSNPMFIVRYSS